MFDYDLISIGSGSSGRTTAVLLKRAGWKVAIIEANVSEHFGGTCINTGCIPTKAMIYKSLQHAPFNEVLTHRDKVVQKIHDGTVRHVKSSVEIEIIEGKAEFVDLHTVKVGERLLTSDYFVVATGSKPAIPPISGIKEVKFSTSDEILKLKSPPNHLITIGGGRIGLELSLMLHNMGTHVTVIEALEHLIPGEDKEIVSEIESSLQNRGIKILTGQFVESVEQNGTNYRVRLKGGETYEGDCLFLATGRIPRTENLGLDKIGVFVDRGGIKVNEYLQTNISHIFAAGDVIGNPMFTNWAHFQATFLAANLKKSKNNSNEWSKLPERVIPRVTFITPELASVGLTEDEAKEKYGDDVVTYSFKVRWLGKSLVLEQTEGVYKGIGIRGKNTIIGAHLWGEKAGSLIQMIVLAMENNLGWNELNSLIYPHPVLSEGIMGMASGVARQINE